MELAPGLQSRNVLRNFLTRGTYSHREIFSNLNSSDQPVEIVPQQIQITGRNAAKKMKKEGKGIISDQLEIRDYRLSATRLEPGGRADGVVVFDWPNFKESTERHFLQIAQADQVDRPILIRLPFTPPISGDGK
jgi:hypothetical protein